MVAFSRLESDMMRNFFYDCFDGQDMANTVCRGPARDLARLKGSIFSMREIWEKTWSLYCATQRDLVTGVRGIGLSVGGEVDRPEDEAEVNEADPKIKLSVNSLDC